MTSILSSNNNFLTYWDTNNQFVGIGNTSNPQSTLDVYGNSTIRSNLNVKNNTILQSSLTLSNTSGSVVISSTGNNTSLNGYSFQINNNTNPGSRASLSLLCSNNGSLTLQSLSDGSAILQNFGNNNFSYYNSTSALFTVSNNGNFGILTASPQYPLQVNGTAQMNTVLTNSLSNNGDLMNNGNIITNNTIYFSNNTGTSFIYGASNDIGINTFNPKYDLDVNGVIRAGGNESLISPFIATGLNSPAIIIGSGNSSASMSFMDIVTNRWMLSTASYVWGLYNDVNSNKPYFGVSNNQVAFFSSNVNIAGRINAAAYDNLLLNTQSTSTTNAPTSALLNTTNNLVVTTSNQLYPSAIFSSNTSVAASNKAYSITYFNSPNSIVKHSDTSNPLTATINWTNVTNNPSYNIVVDLIQTLSSATQNASRSKRISIGLSNYSVNRDSTTLSYGDPNCLQNLYMRVSNSNNNNLTLQSFTSNFSATGPIAHQIECILYTCPLNNIGNVFLT